MYINLNDPEQITMGNVHKMLASVDDSEHSQIRVSKGGRAYVEHGVVGEERIEGVLFRSEETFMAGNGYVGPEAARDLVWVREIYEDLKMLQKAYKDLRATWPNPRYRVPFGYEVHI